MRALQFDEYGPPDVLHVAEAPEPHAAAGQIRIAVRAAALNAFDYKVRRGGMVEVDFPAVPGLDAAGVVDEVGDGIDGVAVGDAVFGSAGAGMAEHAVLKAWAAKPGALSFAEAAGYVTACETAVRCLDTVDVTDGTTLVIAGAAGGVGSAAAQLAVARGARVIGTASERNHDYLRELGAEPTTYGDGQAERIRALAPDGVDAGLDTAGQGAVKDLIELTGDPAKVVTIADFGAGELGAHVSSQAGAWHALEEAAGLFEQGRFSLPAGRTFPLEEASEAYRLLEAGHVRGKLALLLGEKRVEA